MTGLRSGPRGSKQSFLMTSMPSDSARLVSLAADGPFMDFRCRKAVLVPVFSAACLIMRAAASSEALSVL